MIFKLILNLTVFLAFQSQAAIYNQVYKTSQEEGPGQEIPKNMLPRYTTQDGLGNCFSSVGATYGDYLNCRYNVKFKDKQCSSLPPENSYSRLAMGKLADVENENYTDIPGIFPKSGRNANNILQRLIKDKKAKPPSEACASIEKALLNFNDSEEFKKASTNMFDRLESQYNRIHQKVKKCPTCATLTGEDKEELAALQASIQLKDPTEVLKAFSENSYGEFLEKLLIPPECYSPKKSIYFNGPADLALFTFPQTQLDPAKNNLEPTIEMINKVLQNNTPVVVNGICTTEVFDSKVGCKGDSSQIHTLIVTGYRKICPTDGKSACRYSLKVQNSYGATWQQQHNDGWVDADTLLARTSYQKGLLTWVDQTSSTAARAPGVSQGNASTNQ